MNTKQHFLLPRCAGMNCGATDPNHSPECRAEHAAAVAGGRFVMNDNHIADERKKSDAEPIYQVTAEDSDWMDACEEVYGKWPEHARRIVYAAPIAPRADADTAGAKFLVIAMDDDHNGHPTFCVDESAVIAAVRDCMFMADVELDSDETECVRLYAARLIDEGHIHFEGDPSIYLYRLPERIATPASSVADAAGTEYKRMFEDAVCALAAIDKALGIDPDEAGGAAPILEAIARLRDDGNCRSCVSDRCVTGPECVTLGRDAAGQENFMDNSKKLEAEWWEVTTDGEREVVSADHYHRHDWPRSTARPLFAAPIPATELKDAEQ